MTSRNLLARLADLEDRMFGLQDADGRGERWIDRERRLLRIYFAMGLTGSGLVGAIGLIVLLAFAAGPGFDKLGWASAAHPGQTTETARSLSRPGRVHITEFKGPIAGLEMASGSLPLHATPAETAPLRPPFVQVVAVTPVAARATPPPVAPAVTPMQKPDKPAPGKARQASAGVLKTASANASAIVPVVIPAVKDVSAPATAPETAALPVKRPDGLSALGGPVDGKAEADAPGTWWRKIWWGPALLAHLGTDK